MGEVMARIKLRGPKGSAELEALVDTGAPYTKIPPTLATCLGLEATYESWVDMEDGRVIQPWLALAEAEIEGVRRSILVTLGPEGDRPRIGYTTLAQLGLKVNPTTKRLEKTTPIEYGQRGR